MKKVLLSFVIMFIVFLGYNESASAAWSGWSNSKVPVRVWNDASNYGSKAKTIDWKVERKGTGKVYYTVNLRKFKSTGAYIVRTSTGYFSSSTPIKTFDVPSTRMRYGNGKYDIYVKIYSNSAKTKLVGVVSSPDFWITTNV